MINIETEELILFPLAGQFIPGRPSRPTLERWRLHGVRGGVKLATCVVGNKRYTSKEAIERFIQEQNDPGSVTTAANESGATKSARVRRELEKLGV